MTETYKFNEKTGGLVLQFVFLLYQILIDLVSLLAVGYAQQTKPNHRVSVI